MKKKTVLTEANVTSESLFLQRRTLLKALGISTAGLALSPQASAGLFSWLTGEEISPAETHPLTFTPSSKYHPDLKLTPENKVTGYNNFYEFGLDKGDPAKNAQQLRLKPWKVLIDGEIEEPITLDMDDILKRFAQEERIYRLRCVEAWSMVIPWVGFELSQLIKLARPTSKAKFVAFTTLFDPQQMPGQKNPFIGGNLSYPYVEGLTIAEAMHPLTLMATGVYGKTLPPQNGAPLRLVVPWKYGFKSIKSIVHIRFTAERPPTTWNLAAPDEYGFYANVNPQVDHPRWSQASERIISDGNSLRAQRQPTLLFNGYADDVASLYTGLNLRENF